MGSAARFWVRLSPLDAGGMNPSTIEGAVLPLRLVFRWPRARALCRYMGHSSIAVTFDLYGHLFPGNESEAAAFLDAFLDRAFQA